MRVSKSFPEAEGVWLMIWSYHLVMKALVSLVVIWFKAIRILVASKGWVGLLLRWVLRSSIHQRASEISPKKFPGSGMVMGVVVEWMTWAVVSKMARDVGSMVTGVLGLGVAGSRSGFLGYQGCWGGPASE